MKDLLHRYIHFYIYINIGYVPLFFVDMHWTACVSAMAPAYKRTSKSTHYYRPPQYLISLLSI